MPFKKAHLDCSEFYCYHWEDGACEANEPVEELGGNEFCRCMSLSNASQTVCYPPKALYIRIIEIGKRDERGLIRAAKMAGVTTHVIDRDGKEFVTVAHMPGSRAISVFKVRDMSDMILFPCIDGSVGWRHTSQMDLFEGGPG